MKKARKNIGIRTMVFTCALCATLTTFLACDTPQSIAWSYYDCALDTLEKGDPYAAKHFLDACKKEADKVLTLKADSLMTIISRAIEEDKNLKDSLQ